MFLNAAGRLTETGLISRCPAGCSRWWARRPGSPILLSGPNCWITTNQPTSHFTTIIQVDLRSTEPKVNNWRILLVQSFTARMPLLKPTSRFRLGRRRWSSPQQCHLHCHCTLPWNCWITIMYIIAWLGSRVVSVLDSGAVGPGFKSQRDGVG